jgi:Sec-independent protein translocase protein TatA
MKRFVLFLWMVLLCLPLLAQVDSTATGGDGWTDTAAMILSGVLLVVTVIFGAKWKAIKDKLSQIIGTVGDPIEKLREMLDEINKFLKMIPASLEDDKITTDELKKITKQLKLIVEKFKAIFALFKKAGISQ